MRTTHVLVIVLMEFISTSGCTENTADSPTDAAILTDAGEGEGSPTGENPGEAGQVPDGSDVGGRGGQPSQSDWVEFRFSTDPASERRDPIFDFHALGGDAAIEISSDGVVSALGYPESCGGTRPYFEWRLSAESLRALDERVSVLGAMRSEARHVCLGCVGCGHEEFDLVVGPDTFVLNALPAFSPLEGCGPSFEVVEPFSSEMQQLTDSLRSMLRDDAADGRPQSVPTLVRLGAFEPNVWPQAEPLPELVEWPFPEIPLAEVLGTVSRLRPYGVRVLEAELASRVWTFCREARSSWGDSPGGCGPDAFIRVTQADREFLVACAPVLPLEQRLPASR